MYAVPLKSSPRLAASAAFLSDESWALTTQAQVSGERDRGFLIGSGFVLFVCWVGSTAVGAVAGGVIEDPQALGLDFAFTAVFLVLLVGFWRGRQEVIPWASGAGVASFGGWCSTSVFRFFWG